MIYGKKCRRYQLLQYVMFFPGNKCLIIVILLGILRKDAVTLLFITVTLCVMTN